MTLDAPARARAVTAAELGSLFLFESLDAEQLDQLCGVASVRHVGAGPVYAEGEPGTRCFLLLDGEVAISRRSGTQDIELNRTDRRGVYFGALHGFYGGPDEAPYMTSLRAVRACELVVIEAPAMAALVRAWFPMAVHLIQGVISGMRSTNDLLGQRERLLALGSLVAGLTHELNNPASAAVQAAASLRERLAAGRDPVPAALRDRTVAAALAARATRSARSPMDTADAEDELADWMDAHAVPDGWELAPLLAAAGLDPGRAGAVRDEVGAGDLAGVLRGLAYAVDEQLLLADIEDAVRRISALVAAAKQYSQLDRAPDRLVDVHELLDATLTILCSTIGEVAVVTDYDPALPKIPAYAAELNQAWTAVIENALEAMGGRGTLTVRTAREGNWLVVEIGDSGPGIPAEDLPRIFEPFFSTKPVGLGTGLGLDLARRIVVTRHGGDLRACSGPGGARLSARLPIERAPSSPE